MRNQFRRDVTALFEASDHRPGDIVTEADINGIPEPVQRYLQHSRIIGKQRVNTIRLKQNGFMRMNETGGWIPLTAEEYYTVNPPGFVWFGQLKVNPILNFRAKDRLRNGKGSMLVKLLSLIKVVDASGVEMDQGALMRYFSEMIWFPTAFLGSNIQWEKIDSGRARGTFTYGDKQVSADFHINEAGQLTNLVAQRYRSVGKEFLKEKWSTPITNYAELNGLNLPVKGEAVWHLNGGDFSYIKVEITDLEYDTPIGYWSD
jgi:hypothetical protein